MTPHNEHIMLELARTEQREHSRAAEALSRVAGFGPRRRVTVAALVGVGGVLLVAAIMLMAALT